jgi:hypothetical protein
VYIDDIIVFSNSFEDHMRDVHHVLTLLQEAGVILKLSKCRFFVRELDYLGYVVGSGTLKMQDRHIRAVAEMIEPTTLSSVRSVIGLAGVFRRFVKDFASRAKPLTDLFKSKNRRPEPFQLSTSEREAFLDIKNALISPPVLALPKKSSSLILETDASETQIGCILLQDDHSGDGYRPLGYYSRLLSDAERNYSATEREGLAVVWATKILRHQLVGTEFVIKTDHSSLSWLLTGASGDENARITRWRLRLSDLHFTIVHRSGVSNKAADALSRLSTDGHTDAEESLDSIEIFTVSVDDAEMGRILTRLPAPIEVQEMIRAQLASPDQMAAVPHSFENGEGLWVRRSPIDNAEQIIVPEALQKRVLQLAHDAVTAGHPGAKRLYHNIRANFYWRGLAADCYAHVGACHFCARKRLRVKTKTAALTLFLPQQPFEMVSIDLLGPLHETRRGNQYALVITDRFSKLSRAVPVSCDTTAPTIATAYFVHWVSHYGAPLILLSDNGPPFRAKMFKSFNMALGTHTVHTTAYRPQTNGQVERWNKTLLDSVRAFCQEHPEDWDLMLAHASLAYNQTVHSMTGLAPSEIIVPAARHRPLTSSATDALDLPTQFTTPLAYRQAVLRLAERNGKAARETNAARAQRYKEAYDRRIRPSAPIEEGDYVFVRTVTKSKLLLPSTGPHVVEKKRGPVLTVRTPGGPMTVNVDQCVRVPCASTTEPQESADAEDEVAPQQSEFVVDRIVSHGRDPADGHMRVRVRWHGFGSEDDTWEDPQNLPRSFVERYARKKKMRIDRFVTD